jgi:hypothetical protein
VLINAFDVNIRITESSFELFAISFRSSLRFESTFISRNSHGNTSRDCCVAKGTDFDTLKSSVAAANFVNQTNVVFLHQL